LPFAFAEDLKGGRAGVEARRREWRLERQREREREEERDEGGKKRKRGSSVSIAISADRRSQKQ
jgi:hypothetical protein